MKFSEQNRREFLRTLGVTLAAGGAAALLPQLGLISSAAAQSASGTVPGYRALVCVYLAGGNDSWNLLMPYDQGRYDVYAASRSGIHDPVANPGGLAYSRGQLAGSRITDSATSGQYALNPGNVNSTEGTAQLGTLYSAGRLAFLANVGTLVRPITKAEYSTTANRPPQLFSHNDQENLWHLARTTASTTGWGGLLADQVASSNVNQSLSAAISLAGSNRFSVGDSTFPYQMASSGLTNIANIFNSSSSTGGTHGATRGNALNQLLASSYSQPLTGEYARTFKNGRDLYSLLNDGLNSTAGTVGATFPNENLANQLRMVSRMIKLSRTVGSGVEHQRQVYFVRLGGFDLHDGLMSIGNGGQGALLQRVSQAMGSFWTALEEIGATNEVTTFTMSEFARTLNSNGNGSDHGWGGVQMVMGGAVNGGRLYGSFPDQALNGPVSFSRGQTIPSTSVDQMAATLARWMGVTNTDQLNTIFPNLSLFSSSNLGFLRP